MKIRPEHYAYLRDALAPLAPEIPERRAAITAEGRAHDVEKRLRWDLLYAARLTPWICDTLYVYEVNDEHIDTALRAILKEIEVAPAAEPGM